MVDISAPKNMVIEQWEISRPIPYAKNARKLSPHAIDKVAQSLQEFGWQQPLVVDAQGVLIVGHTRLLAAKQLKYTHVPVLVAHWLTPAQVKAYRLMDNRSHDETTWDFDLLGPEFEELKGLDFNLELTGFDSFMWNLTNGVAPGWEGMPAYNHEDQTAFQTLHVHFSTAENRDKFAALIGQPLSDKTRSVWYPPADIGHYADKRYSSGEESTQPRYPVYVISKGRWESRLTSKALEQIGVEYRIVVEPQEYENYAAVIDPAKILVLPFSNLGQGSIPARNWVWDHAINEGYARHWILDDNIKRFYRFNLNLKTPVSDGAVFCAAEDFTDRYENVGLSGFQYFMFVSRKDGNTPPITTNTRIYSHILIDNTIPFRWRGRYNEDTDLSLRVLKSGLCTILFNAFLAEKTPTMVMKGGNTDELYKGDGRLKMAESLRDQHPDVVTITRKWKRWQHQVDYRPFRDNKFIPKPGFEVPTEANNYGMELEYLTNAG